jgi:hypothetical protein
VRSSSKKLCGNNDAVAEAGPHSVDDAFGIKMPTIVLVAVEVKAAQRELVTRFRETVQSDHPIESC